MITIAGFLTYPLGWSAVSLVIYGFLSLEFIGRSSSIPYD